MALRPARLVLPLILSATMLWAQPAGSAEAVKQLEDWAQRLRTSSSATMSDAEQERLGEILKAAKDWTPADKLKGVTTLINLLTWAGARRLLLPMSGAYISLIISGLEAINEAQFQRYVIAREAGQTPEQAWNVANPELRANFELRYQYGRLLKLLQSRTAPGVWKLEVADQTIDEMWDKREYKYKVTNLGNTRICDFSLVLHNDKVKGDVAGEMILSDGRVIPDGWKLVLGGNVIRFETDDPKACIERNRFKEFTFRVWWKNYAELGTVTATGSTLDRNGEHQGIPAADIGEFYGPAAVSVEPSTPPEGSRVVLTGSVVEAQPATLTALSPGGAVLSGIVLDVNGQQRKTDDQGRLQVVVPAGISALAVAFNMLSGGGPVATSTVVKNTGAASTPPTVTTSTPYPSPGGDLKVTGSSFSGTATQTTVRIGDRQLPVLAASPVEVIASVPADMPPGDTGPLTVSTSAGVSLPRRVQVVRLRLESGSTKLVRGQSGKARVVVEGTTDRVPLTITNLTPQVIQLQGGSTQTKTSTGGATNMVPLEFRSVSSGDFQVQAVVSAPPSTKP